MSFTLFFGGAEVPGWRSLLLDANVSGLSITYWNLRQRLPKRKPWRLADQVPPGTTVLVESGAFTANKDPGRLDADGWRAYDEEYRAFVEANLDRIDIVSEFDSLVLGPGYIHDQREAFWDALGPRFLPVWHPQVDSLADLAGRYERVCVPNSNLDTRAQARINALSTRAAFHGAAITQPDVIAQVRFSSAASTSWLSPIQFGDTIVWDGTRLRRYPRKYKDAARKRHRTLFERAGFDAAKIADGDPTEVARFTVWSWLKWEQQMAQRRGTATGAVTAPAEEREPGTADSPPVAVDGPDGGVRHLPVARPERMPLPVFGMAAVEVDGETQRLPVLNQESLRRCDTCHVAGSCPAFNPGHECAYGMPVEVHNKDQLVSLLTGVIEMQAQRVAFSRFSEELEGGYPDPNVSSEIDRLFRLTESLKDIQDTRDILEVHAKVHAGAGVLSRIFGEKETQPVQAFSRPLDGAETDQFLADIVDAEVVSPVTAPTRHSLGGGLTNGRARRTGTG